MSEGTIRESNIDKNNYLETGIKSEERVNKFGEVYTPQDIVCKMSDMVGESLYRMDKTVLEPSCGNGNFMVELIKRKMEGAIKEVKEKGGNFDLMTLKAVSLVYGVDIIVDNIEESKNRMMDVIQTMYTEHTGNEITEELKKSVKFILDRNVILGNTLTQMKLEPKTKRKPKPGTLVETIEDGDLMISEWKFDMQEETIRRVVYTFKNLDIVDHDYKEVHYTKLHRQRDRKRDVNKDADGII